MAVEISFILMTMEHGNNRIVCLIIYLENNLKLLMKFGDIWLIRVVCLKGSRSPICKNDLQEIYDYENAYHQHHKQIRLTIQKDY